MYPMACRACDVWIGADSDIKAGPSAWLCPECVEQLSPVRAPFCSVCGESYDGAIDRAFACPNCEDRRLAFDFAISAYKSEGPLKELIHRFKYGRDLSLRGALADALLPALDDPRLAAEDLSGWLLVPVPLHWTRRALRGFNQSWELCQQLSRRTGIAAVQALRRARRTPRQARLSRSQRLENMRGVFSLALPGPASLLRGNRLRDARVLLVDDVLTTGATAHECARVLRERGGAQKVVVITAARG